MARADESAFVALPYGDNPSFGLTIREWFAGQAPQLPDQIVCLLSAGETDPVATVKKLASLLSTWAFTYADAMIAESQKK